MYAASVDTFSLTFQASGSLWQDALVMQDLQTQSLWSQISGRCIQGVLKGSELELFSSFHTTYAEFQSHYPDGLVLAKPERSSESHYAKYFHDPSRLGIFGRADNFTRLPAKSIVYGLRQTGASVAVSHGALEARGFVLIDDITPAVVIVWEPKGNTAVAFKLPPNKSGKRWDFMLSEGQLAATGHPDKWDAFTGEGNGDINLQPAPLISAFWFAWVSFFPDTELID